MSWPLNSGVEKRALAMIIQFMHVGLKPRMVKWMIVSLPDWWMLKSTFCSDNVRISFSGHLFSISYVPELFNSPLRIKDIPYDCILWASDVALWKHTWIFAPWPCHLSWLGQTGCQKKNFFCGRYLNRRRQQQAWHGICWLKPLYYTQKYSDA